MRSPRTLICYKVSVCTVRRFIRAAGLGRIVSLKPFLSVKYIRNRKKWCAKYFKMDPENEKHIFWINLAFKHMSI